MSDQIYFFDTTLRDGEQCPGASMNLREKLEVARQMERLGMDVIEAGFPCISDGDFEAVHTIAREIKKCRIAGLARCVKADIEAAARALEPAGERARIHIFLATSKLHMQFKLKKSGIRNPAHGGGRRILCQAIRTGRGNFPRRTLPAQTWIF